MALALLAHALIATSPLAGCCGEANETCGAASFAAITEYQCKGMTQRTYASTPAACVAVCCATPLCHTWLFHDPSAATPTNCWLGDGPCNGHAAVGWNGGSRKPPPPPPTWPPTPAPAGQCAFPTAVSTACTGMAPGPPAASAAPSACMAECCARGATCRTWHFGVGTIGPGGCFLGYGPCSGPAAPGWDGGSRWEALSFAWYNGTSKSASSTARLECPKRKSPNAAELQSGLPAVCPCPAAIGGAAPGCRGCHDFPGAFCQHAHGDPQALILGFGGDGMSPFMYQSITTFLVQNLRDTLGKRVRFEWVPSDWQSCRSSFCSKHSAGGNHTYITCMKAAARGVLRRAREKYNLSHVTLIGHSAGTTPVIELMGDARLPGDWTVDRVILISPGRSQSLVDTTNATAIAQRAARDGTQLAVLYGPDDPESTHALAYIEKLWGRVCAAGASGPARCVAPVLSSAVRGMAHPEPSDYVLRLPTAQAVLAAFTWCAAGARCG